MIRVVHPRSWFFTPSWGFPVVKKRTGISDPQYCCPKLLILWRGSFRKRNGKRGSKGSDLIQEGNRIPDPRHCPINCWYYDEGALEKGTGREEAVRAAIRYKKATGSRIRNTGDKQWCGSMSFWSGSRSWIRILLFSSLTSRCQQKTNFLTQIFLLITFWSYI